jgi:hypothetical protein
MLTKRTQILFDQQLWISLVQLAKEKDISVGELVRTAVRKEYIEEAKQERVGKAVEDILLFRKKYGKELAKGNDSAQILRKMRDSRYGKSI